MSEQTNKHAQKGINSYKGGEQLQSISNTCFARIMVMELLIAISNKWGAEHGRGSEQNLCVERNNWLRSGICRPQCGTRIVVSGTSFCAVRNIVDAVTRILFHIIWRLGIPHYKWTWTWLLRCLFWVLLLLFSRNSPLCAKIDEKVGWICHTSQIFQQKCLFW